LRVVFIRDCSLPRVGDMDALTCEWRYDGVWISACGAAFQFNEDGPTENGFAFCFKCGNPIVVKADAEDLELSANAGIERPMKPQEGRSE
jgi:hypothetical protein